MAEKALKQLEEQLQCQICLDTYTDPKLLPCNHIYCQDCLSGLVVRRSRQGRSSLNCPACRLAVSVPPGGVSKLPSAFQVNSLLEIQDSLKLATQPVAISTETGPSESSKATLSCSQHEGEELKLFCETCQELICFKCALRSGNHCSHSYDEIAVALETCKEQIASSLTPVESQLTTIDKALTELNLRCEEISDQRATTEASIHDRVRQFHELLEVRKTELISQLDQATQAKLQALAIQREQLETSQAQLTSCIDFLKENLSTTGDVDVLKRKSFMLSQVEQLIEPFEPELLKPNTESDVGFLVLADIASVCKNYGRIVNLELAEESVKSSIKSDVASSPDGLYCEYVSTIFKKVASKDSCAQEAAAVLDTAFCDDDSLLPNPSKCYITGDNASSATVDAPSVAILHAVDSNSDVCQEAIESLDCRLVSEITESSVDCSVQMISAGQYEINYRPTVKGKHYLHVKVNRQYIEGCPAPITVTSPIVKLGRLIGNISVKKPWGVVINQRGELMVSEHDAHCISVYSPNGYKLRSFGSLGHFHGQLSNPRGMALDGEGNVIVADYKNHRLQKFTIDGKYLNAVGTKGSGPLQFKSPKNVAYNPFNKRLYVVDENNRVQILTSDFSYCGVFGKIGWSYGQFNDPWGIACDSEGNVFVADSTSRIQAFTFEGQFKWQFGKRGGGLGQLNFPSDIAFDRNNRCFYVSERYNHRVSVFDAEGDFITCFGCFGSSPGELKYPRGLTVDSSGVVYVCDNNNNRLSMF